MYGVCASGAQGDFTLLMRLPGAGKINEEGGQMRVLITGGGGFLGQKLARAILAKGELTRAGGKSEAVDELVLFDQVAPRPIDDPRVKPVSGDIADAATVRGLITPGTHSIFHLAAVVSAGAEADFDLGYRVNLDGTRLVLEAARALPEPARLVFASSIATYGGGLPDIVDDDTPQRPETSYGAQKAIGEALVNDYSRKGFIDGRSLRLPTITIRPGKPNKAASTWASSIMREPLQGEDVIAPVTKETPMACLGPRACVQNLLRVHEAPAEAFGKHRSVLLTGIRITAGEMEAALYRNAGNRKLGKVIWEHDPAIQKIVDGWPKETRSARAAALGMQSQPDVDGLIREFIEDELDGK